MIKLLYCLLILSLFFTSAFSFHRTLSENKRFLDKQENSSNGDIDINQLQKQFDLFLKSKELQESQNTEGKNNENKISSDYNSTDSTQQLSVIGTSSGRANQGRAVIRFTYGTTDSEAYWADLNSTKILNNTREIIKTIGLENSALQVIRKQVFQDQVQVSEDQSLNQTAYLFRVVLSFEVSAKSEFVGDILDKVIQSGVSQMDSVDYYSSDEDIQALRQSLLEQAIESCHRQARKVIDTFGYELGPAMNIKILNEEDFDLNKINEQSKSDDLVPELEYRIEVQYSYRTKQDVDEQGNDEKSSGEGKTGEESADDENNVEPCSNCEQP